MKSLLGATILQFAFESPRSGYDMTKEMALTHAWSASHQQIYRECKKLHAQGAMQFEAHNDNQGKPDKKIYSLTPYGEELLADARNGNYKAIKPPKTHCESTVMLRIGNARYFEALHQQIDEQLELYRQELKRETDPAEKLLIERSINLLAIEKDFAAYSLELIDPDNERTA